LVSDNAELPLRRLESIRDSTYLLRAVPALAPGDAERLLRFVAEAESVGDDHPFAGPFLAQLGRLIPADWILYSELDLREGKCPGERYDLECPEGYGAFCDLEWGTLEPVLATNPVFVRFRKGSSDALKISDFLTRRELHRTRLYNLVLKPCGLEDSLGVRLPIPPRSRSRVFVFDRGGRDFSDRDRVVLDMLSPHLVRVHRVSENRRRLSAALALHESMQAAVVLLEADDRVAFVSTAARELLDCYFGESGVRLPDSLTSWLRERRRVAIGEPLRVDAGDRSLVVHLVDGALLLEEERPLSRLTRREREILGLVAEGRTNTEIAERLWVSPGTVRKHLDNVYAKLGVHTRTAAAAFVRERRLLARD
jgi:DNA-binding NarL/FixJ family response regulator